MEVLGGLKDLNLFSHNYISVENRVSILFKIFIC